MDKKEAQQRSTWNKLRPSNITRQIGKINPIYRDEYAKLKAADDAIRDIALGEHGFSLKELIKDLKKNQKTRHWLAVLDRAVRINNMVKSIVNHDYVNELFEGRQENIRDFYFSDTDAGGAPIDTDRIHETVASFEDYLIKEALFGDMSRRITDKFLSNFYDKKEREVRRAMNNAASLAESLASRTINAFKELDTARAKGQVGQYLNILNSLKKEQEKFHTELKSTYDAVKDYLPQKEVEEPEKEPEEDTKTEEVQEEKEQDKPLQDGSFPDVSIGPEGLGGQEAQQPQEQRSNLPPMPQPPKRPLPRFDEQSDSSSFNQLDLPFEEDESNIYATAAKRALASGQKGIAVAILSKYSQVLDDSGRAAESAKILAIAEDLLHESK